MIIYGYRDESGEWSFLKRDSFYHECRIEVSRWRWYSYNIAYELKRLISNHIDRMPYDLFDREQNRIDLEMRQKYFNSYTQAKSENKYFIWDADTQEPILIEKKDPFDPESQDDSGKPESEQENT